MNRLYKAFMNWRNTAILEQDRIVIGISDKTVSQKLQLKSNLTLETAIQVARQSELVKSQVTDQSSYTPKDLDEVHTKKKSVHSLSLIHI